MADKFGRQYEIQILTPDQELITIEPPFSVQFSIERNTLASANKCDLKIYNLSPDTRNRIYKDRYSISEYWQFVIKAGYEKLVTVFQGNIYEALSVKQGTEWITEIDAFDGMHAIQNGYTAETIQKNTPKQTPIDKVISDMPELIKGVMGTPTQGENKRGLVMMGQSSKVLQELVDDKFFIDGEVVNILDNDEYISIGKVPLIDSNQLLSSPKRRETFIEVDILFFPEIQPGIICELRSSEKIYNGQYKVMGFKHDVTISGALCGEAKTQLSLYAGAAGLKAAQ